MEFDSVSDHWHVLLSLHQCNLNLLNINRIFTGKKSISLWHMLKKLAKKYMMFEILCTLGLEKKSWNKYRNRHAVHFTAGHKKNGDICVCWFYKSMYLPPMMIVHIIH